MQLGTPRNMQPTEHRLVNRLMERDVKLLVRRLVQRLMPRAMQLRKRLLMQVAMQLRIQLPTRPRARRTIQPAVLSPMLRPVLRRMPRETQWRVRREAAGRLPQTRHEDTDSQIPAGIAGPRIHEPLFYLQHTKARQWRARIVRSPESRVRRPECRSANRRQPRVLGVRLRCRVTGRRRGSKRSQKCRDLPADG